MARISRIQEASERFWGNNIPVKIMIISGIVLIATRFFSGNFYMGVYMGLTVTGYMGIVHSSYVNELKGRLIKEKQAPLPAMAP